MRCPSAAAEVADVTRARYPDLRIPYHSRWRHFEAGGVDRNAELDARAMVDLTVVSVLLDAGAGPDWHYLEASSGQRFSRSEGLGVASWHAFCRGMFSGDAARPLLVDAAGLRSLTVERLAEAFQCAPANPLVGLEGRVCCCAGSAMRWLAARCRPQGQPEPLRPDRRETGSPHTTSCRRVLASLSGIWLAPNSIGPDALGDCWRHDAVPGPGLTRGWVPFHKLSQWLTYSLLEPFEWAGVHVEGLDALTGLPEYRNGGLLLDTGVLRLREPAWAARNWEVERRAGGRVARTHRCPARRTGPAGAYTTGLDAGQLPLACVLEGGILGGGPCARRAAA